MVELKKIKMPTQGALQIYKQKPLETTKGFLLHKKTATGIPDAVRH